MRRFLSRESTIISEGLGITESWYRGIPAGERAIRLPYNGRKRNVSLTTRALNKGDPDDIRNKGQTLYEGCIFFYVMCRLI